MPGLSFPDVNVWMAALLPEHIHHELAKSWWESDEFDSICFTRVTQISVLRLLTTPAIMNGKPLTIKAAWKLYDRSFSTIEWPTCLKLPKASVISAAAVRIISPRPKFGMTRGSLRWRRATTEQLLHLIPG